MRLLVRHQRGSYRNFYFEAVRLLASWLMPNSSQSDIKMHEISHVHKQAECDKRKAQTRQRNLQLSVTESKVGAWHLNRNDWAKNLPGKKAELSVRGRNENFQFCAHAPSPSGLRKSIHCIQTRQFAAVQNRKSILERNISFMLEAI